MQTFLDTAFLGLGVLLLAFCLANRFNIAATTYLAATIGYTMLGHLVWRLQKNPFYSDDTYLTAHLIEFAYVTTFAMLMLNSQKGNDFFKRAIMSSRTTVLSLIFLSWFALQGYLILSYGTTGTLSLNSSGSDNADRAYIDSALLSVLNTFANGAALLIVGRLALQPEVKRNLVLVIPFAAFILYNLAFATATAGGRRTILLLGLFYALAKFVLSGEKLSTAVRRSLIPIGLAMSAVLGLAAFYQEIRLNSYLPEVSRLLGSPDLSNKFEGLILLLTPGAAADYGIRSESLSGTVNRSGAFDNLYSITEGVSSRGITMDGQLTLFAIGKSIPRSLYPNKPDYDIDLLIGQRYGIAPGQDFGVRADFFLEPDYSTTLLSMFVADFGWLGIFAAAVVMTLTIRFTTWSLSLFPTLSIVSAGLMGAVFETIGTLEGSLINALATLRTVVLVIVVGLAMTALSEFLNAPLKRGRGPAFKLHGIWPNGITNSRSRDRK